MLEAAAKDARNILHFVIASNHCIRQVVKKGAEPVLRGILSFALSIINRTQSWLLH